MYYKENNNKFDGILKLASIQAILSFILYTIFFLFVIYITISFVNVITNVGTSPISIWDWNFFNVIIKIRGLF